MIFFSIVFVVVVFVFVVVVVLPEGWMKKSIVLIPLPSLIKKIIIVRSFVH